MDGTVQVEKLLDYLKSLEANGFYGKVFISFNNGKVTNMKLEASLDLDQFRSVEVANEA